MAPAIKELSQWLDANLEYFVAPDWADVVKHSVSLADCILLYLFFSKSASHYLIGKCLFKCCE